MIITLNEILFLFSTLFGLDTVFIAEETKLILDLESKTGTIEYINLQTPTQFAKYAETGLNKIEESAKFKEHFNKLELDSKTIEKKEGKLNAQLNFSFKDQKKILELLHFSLLHHGEDSPSDAFYYYPFLFEKLISCNGNEKKTNDNIVIEWEKDTKIINLNLKLNEQAKKEMGDLKSVVEYYRIK